MGEKTLGLPAAIAFADFPLFHLRSLKESATHADTPMQSFAATTTRGHAG